MILILLSNQRLFTKYFLNLSKNLFCSINTTRAPTLGAGVSGTSFDLSAPIYQCASLHESRAKNLCRKQPLRMLEHTQGTYYVFEGLQIVLTSFRILCALTSTFQLESRPSSIYAANQERLRFQYRGTCEGSRIEKAKIRLQLHQSINACFSFL